MSETRGNLLHCQRVCILELNARVRWPGEPRSGESHAPQHILSPRRVCRSQRVVRAHVVQHQLHHRKLRVEKRVDAIALPPAPSVVTIDRDDAMSGVHLHLEGLRVTDDGSRGALLVGHPRRCT